MVCYTTIPMFVSLTPPLALPAHYHAHIAQHTSVSVFAHPSSRPAAVYLCHGHSRRIPSLFATRHIASRPVPSRAHSLFQHLYEYHHVCQPKV
ncbi:hypothetical protein BD779DRAFT_1535519 [Infundibulicybe gibba]|nr:hypothetical protein BD779DRAFT_1535519 [Infundibulicybe gibba]